MPITATTPVGLVGPGTTIVPAAAPLTTTQPAVGSGLTSDHRTVIGQPSDSQPSGLVVPQLTGVDPARPLRFTSNGILDRLSTTGAGQQTANQDGLRGVLGVEASRTMARTDSRRVMRFKEMIDRAAVAHDLPPALLAGLISRESRGGSVLRESGFSRFRDPGEGEYGLCQIDPRAHDNPTQHRPTSFDHIDQAAGILRSYIEQVARKHPTWSVAQKVRGAVAAYNFGVGAVRTLGKVDKGTTGGDYSADIWARAQYYAESW
jgi:hypothetical protein